VKIVAPGRYAGAAPHRLHLQVEGSGGPVVVLEAGIAASSVSWSLIQKRIAALTTVVSYDRGGFGWSDPPRVACTAANAADELEGMLREAGLGGPYVLVGHSFGGLIVRRFQQQFPEQVAGMVLVDPVVRAEWREASEAKRRMLARGVMLSRRGAVLARIGVVGFALRMLTSGSQRVPKLLARVSVGNGASVTDRLVGEVRKMPREVWPAIAQHWSQAQSFQAMAGYLENLPLSAGQLDEERSLDDLPLVVLSASKLIPEHAHDAGLSTRGRHIVVPDSGHWIQLDAPDAVVDAIESVL
jgi:pimeloyl-ACP methyl ester carboxylesterase